MNFPKYAFHNLFVLDHKSPLREWNNTNNYESICGQTLLNNETVCSEKLWLVNPDDGDVVPNIVHIILPFSTRDIDLVHSVCILSAFWMNQPHFMILWHVHDGPNGSNWEYLKQNLTSQLHRVILVKLTLPKLVYSQPMVVKQYIADVFRLEILYWFGGIYLDLDVIVLKSFKPLFKYPFTIGRETPNGLCNGAMVSSRGNFLLKRWHLLYRFHQQNSLWADMSVFLPNTIFTIVPEYFHVEEDSMDRPNWSEYELRMIYGRGNKEWDWKGKNYCVHLWFRKGGLNLTLESIKSEDSMFGDMLRFILYGNETIID